MASEVQQSKTEFKCKGKSQTVLKRHISRKHKPETLRLNTEHMNSSISLHLSPVLDGKEDCNNDTTSTLEVQIYKCEVCNHEIETEAAFHGHESLQHNPSITHTSKWEKNTCHICHTTFTNTTHFQSHLIEQHRFVSDTDACFNCESTGPLGYFTQVPDQLIYMYCKECEIFQNPVPV